MDIRKWTGKRVADKIMNLDGATSAEREALLELYQRRPGPPIEPDNPTRELVDRYALRIAAIASVEITNQADHDYEASVKRFQQTARQLLLSFVGEYLDSLNRGCE